MGFTRSSTMGFALKLPPVFQRSMMFLVWCYRLIIYDIFLFLSSGRGSEQLLNVLYGHHPKFKNWYDAITSTFHACVKASA